MADREQLGVAFAERVRQVFVELDENQPLFLKYLVMEWAVKDLARVIPAHEVIAILFYGGLVSCVGKYDDETLISVIGTIVQLCNDFVSCYPSASQHLNSFAERFDPRTKMLKFLISGGATPITELISRYLINWTKDAENSVTNSGYRELSASLLKKVPHLFKGDVLSQLLTSNRMQSVRLINEWRKEVYFDFLVELFLPSFIENEDDFIYFFTLVKIAHDEAETKQQSIKALVGKHLDACCNDRRKCADFHQLLSFNL